MAILLAAQGGLSVFAQQLVNGLTTGMLFALIAIGYTMVYGIIELINFAHGDLFMLGSFLALTVVGWLGLVAAGTGFPTAVLVLVFIPVFFSLRGAPRPAALRRPSPQWLMSGVWSLILTAIAFGATVAAGAIVAKLGAAGHRTVAVVLALCFILVLSMGFCACLNFTVDRLVYKPLRNAPKLTPLVSAIGVSFMFMGLGQIWKGVADINFPDLLPNRDLVASESLRFTLKDLVVYLVTVPLMVGLTVFVKFTKLGKAMRATAQNPVAARLMGIDVDRVIGATFVIGGALAGAASVVYSLHINTVSYQMGYQNGLYAFTAAVLGGIGNLPGAMLGGIVIGLVRSLGSQYVGEQWTSALVFGILILLLIFRPTGLLGARMREKV